jgi:glycerol-3-phosphate acyltransferase PlsY
MNPAVVSAVVGYFLGSIPFGYLLVRIFRGTDVRATGSGNIGATNVARTSPMLGATTLLLDLLKGAAAVWIATTAVSNNRLVGFIAALSAICGHLFPIWLRFRGGKGVATGLGAFLLLTPRAILTATAIFVVVVLISHFVSLSSIVAAASLPFSATVFAEARGPGQIGLLSLASALIIWRHHNNIGRLISGTEPRFQMRRK